MTLKTPAMSHIDAEIQWVWQAYRERPRRILFNRLVTHYLPLVRAIAGKLKRKLPDEIRVDELVSDGVLGLMESIKRYDIDRGLKFSSFCSQRIVGSMLDGLRSMDRTPRLTRKRERLLAKVRHKIEQEFGRAASDQEISEALGIDESVLPAFVRDATPRTTISLNDRFTSYQDNEFSLVKKLEDPRYEDPDEQLQNHDIWSVIARKLHGNERTVIRMYYFEDATMAEIGKSLDMSESRISQIHKKALEYLRELRPMLEQSFANGAK